MGRELGRFLEQRREELGLSRRDLAERTELSYSYVSQLETGDREPALKAMRALAPVLEVAIEELASLVAGDDWSGGLPERSLGVLASGRGLSASRQPSASRSSESRPPEPRTYDRALLSVERRLREVPPLERIALLNTLIAHAVEELSEADR